MIIEITKKISPFTHTPGTFFLLPFTEWEVQVFPVKLRFRNLKDHSSFDVDVDLRGPHRDFTVEQNIEKGQITVFSHTKEGFVRYHIASQKEGVSLFCEKVFARGLAFSIENKEVTLLAKTSYLIEFSSFVRKETSFLEKLFLGVHKQQIFPALSQRKSLAEILPIWFALSQTLPTQKKETAIYGGTAFFLQQCKEKIEKKEKTQMTSSLLAFYEGAFEGVFSPRGEEVNFLGIVPKSYGTFPPLLLLEKSYLLLRSLFFQEENSLFSFLPCLPPELPSGRMTHVKTKEEDLLHWEWSKKMMRKLIIIPGKTREISLVFPSSIDSFRVRRSPKEKGSLSYNGSSLLLEEKKILYFDHFQK